MRIRPGLGVVLGGGGVRPSGGVMDGVAEPTPGRGPRARRVTFAICVRGNRTADRSVPEGPRCWMLLQLFCFPRITPFHLDSEIDRFKANRSRPQRNVKM